MGWLRRRVRGLERASRGEMVAIKQMDGSTKRFPESALAEAFVINAQRFCGENIPVHALTEAADSSSDPWWRESFYSTPRVIDPDGNKLDPVGHPPEDLSEQLQSAKNDE